MLDKTGQPGLILSCDPHSYDLQARLDGGVVVHIPFCEITRQTNLSAEYALRQVGRTLFMQPLSQEDPTLYSIRAYEEARFQQIRRDFLDGTRNTYPARFKLIAPGGKLAFYQLAQGVNGAVHVKEFSCGRIDDFNRIEMPRELPIIVREIDAQGRLVLTARPAFGTFDDTLRRLSLSPGSLATGTVCFHFPKAVGVMLSPNIMTLADSDQFPPTGSCVQVEILRIDASEHKIRSRLIGPSSDLPMRHADWVVPLPGPWTDLEAFAQAVEVKKPPAENETLKPPPEPPTFCLEAERSPFCTYPQETITREQNAPVAPQSLYRQVRPGHTDARLSAVAQAVEELRYCTAWQLQRYLYLRNGLLIERARLNGLLERLCTLDVLSALRFSSGGVECKFKTYHPSLNYRCLMERNPRNFGAADLAEANPARVKARLASNQLLLGMLNEAESSPCELDTHPYLFDRESGVRVRPKHMLTCGGLCSLIDAFRMDDQTACEEKLARYGRYFGHNPRDNMQLCLVVEDSQQETFLEVASRAGLPFPVLLTTDLRCLPAPQFETVSPSPAKKGLLKQLLDRLMR